MGGSITPLVYRTDSPGKWGNGKGVNLTPAEVDENMFELAKALSDVAAMPSDSIAAITAANNALSIVTASGKVFGPFALPVASLEYTGDFVPFANYKYSDLLTGADGLYFVTQDHISEGVFNPARGVYRKVMPLPTGCDIGFFYPGLVGTGLATGGTMFAHLAGRSFYLPEFLPGSVGKLEAATVDAMVLKIFKNTTQIGSAQFAAGAAAATFSFDVDVQFNAGDILRVPRPDTIDSAASSLVLTFAAKLGLVS